jgi:hypothetical protein
MVRQAARRQYRVALAAVVGTGERQVRARPRIRLGRAGPAALAAEAKILDTYVRGGIYAVNEARNLLGLAPVSGGDVPMVYGTQGAVPLAEPITPQKVQRGFGGDPHGCSCGAAARHAVAPSVRKYNPNVEDEPRAPAGNPGGGSGQAMAVMEMSASQSLNAMFFFGRLSKRRKLWTAV